MKKYSLMFLRFLECASGLYDTDKNEFVIPHHLLAEATETGWFTHHRDWDCFTASGREEAVRALNEQDFAHDHQAQLALTPYRYLPHYAKVTIERLDNDSPLREHDVLMTLLNAYAGSYGEEKVDIHVRESVEAICQRRFANYVPYVPKPEEAGDGLAFPGLC